MLGRITMLACLSLCGCEAILDMLSTDTLIEASCIGDDTVVVGGRDMCEEFERYGKVTCDVGYKVRLNGTTVCPPPFGEEPL